MEGAAGGAGLRPPGPRHQGRPARRQGGQRRRTHHRRRCPRLQQHRGQVQGARRRGVPGRALGLHCAGAAAGGAGRRLGGRGRAAGGARHRPEDRLQEARLGVRQELHDPGGLPGGGGGGRRRGGGAGGGGGAARGGARGQEGLAEPRARADGGDDPADLPYHAEGRRPEARPPLLRQRLLRPRLPLRAEVLRGGAHGGPRAGPGGRRQEGGEALPGEVRRLRGPGEDGRHPVL